MSDLTFSLSGGCFNCRVAAVIVRDGKILAMQDDRSPYWYLPGGRMRLGETAQQALGRELEEELGAAGELLRPLWLNQGFFTEEVSGKRFHELCLYFLVRLSADQVPDGEFFRREGERLHRFCWLSFEQLEGEDVYPLFLKKEIFRLPEGFTLRTEYE